jgi:hypothetical protein
MRAEQHDRQLPARRESRRLYFVGRRQGEVADVYAVSADDVRRLQSARRGGESKLDWNGSGEEKMELGHLLISRIVEQRPSRELQARFALYVLSNLPYDGFVLHADEIWRWLLAAADERDFLSASAAPRSWPRRLRSLLPAVPTLGLHA